MNGLKENTFHIILIGVFALLVMAGSFYYGLTSSNDLSHHFQLAGIFYDSIVSHDFYPSLANAANHGYGDFTVRFYPPFSYYILSSFFLIVGDWYYAGLIAFFLIFWASGIGAYFLAREQFTAKQSLITAAIYIFAPYHINQIYNSFFYAEFTAAAILPFCFLFIVRISRGGRLQDILGLSIFYALLILTHLPSTVIGSLSFIFFSLLLLRKDNFLKTITKLFLSILLALTASSFYWIRMITELKWVNLSVKSFYSGTYDYRENFLLRPTHFLDFDSDTLSLWLADLMILAIILISIPSILFFFKERRKLSQFAIAISAVFFISVFMTTQLSKPVWDNISFLQNVQFPWRWMGVVSISGAVFSTFGIVFVSEKLNHAKNSFLTIGVGFVLAYFVFCSAFVIKQAVYLSHDEFNPAAFKERDFDKFWWTIWAKNEALGIKDKAVAEGRETEISAWTSLEKNIKVSAGNPATLRIASFYYPYWHASINGTEVPIEKTGDGAISISLPENESLVSFYFREPLFVRTANFISFALWISFLIFSLILFAQSRSQKLNGHENL